MVFSERITIGSQIEKAAIVEVVHSEIFADMAFVPLGFSICSRIYERRRRK